MFTVFGENLGPAQSPPLSFPLSSTLGGVSIGVTQSGATTQAFPIFVSAGQINAVMPSTVNAGLATLRLTYQANKSNAITVQIADSAPGVFAVSSGGFGPGIVQNYVAANNQPINSLTTPAAPGQVITIWGTGLGPVTFPDNVAPTAGNVATPVTVTIGGHPATVAYSGRTPCCSGVDQIVATIPNNAPLGCWVPVSVNAGGVVSNTTTMAIAAAGATSCSDPGNPLSTLVQTAGTQAFIHPSKMSIRPQLSSRLSIKSTRGSTRALLRPTTSTPTCPFLRPALAWFIKLRATHIMPRASAEPCLRVPASVRSPIRPITMARNLFRSPRLFRSIRAHWAGRSTRLLSP